MSRSHPPSVLTLVERVLRDEIVLGEQRRILVAVSGGMDSMVLLHALAHLRERLNVEVSAHGVDHGLRPEAAAELDLAESAARRWGVPFARTSVQLKPGGNLQARARELRHRALRAASAEQRGAWIATAHHADDRAETFLLRLLRGTSPRGLAVLPAQAGVLIRPLIRARRRDIQLHATRHDVPYANDPSNQDGRFLRVRVRQELVPLLERLSPGVIGHLTALADELAEPQPEFPALPEPDLVLGREQRRQLSRALAEGNARIRVRVSGGRELRLNPKTRSFEFVSASADTEAAAEGPSLRDRPIAGKPLDPK
ncbi:MAG TPA: tRNA lysidine(34) synthetase TilS [Polyangiaceae bacterium]|nr:tRNA lysidine(34) synthetase TilS [Polyangiaceae bacterium]